MIQQGRPWHKYKDKLLKDITDVAIAQKFSWTLEYIRSMDDDDYMACTAMLHGMAKAQEEIKNKKK